MWIFDLSLSFNPTNQLLKAAKWLWNKMELQLLLLLVLMLDYRIFTIRQKSISIYFNLYWIALDLRMATKIVLNCKYSCFVNKMFFYIYLTRSVRMCRIFFLGARVAYNMSNIWIHAEFSVFVQILFFMMVKCNSFCIPENYLDLWSGKLKGNVGPSSSFVDFFFYNSNRRIILDNFTLIFIHFNAIICWTFLGVSFQRRLLMSITKVASISINDSLPYSSNLTSSSFMFEYGSVDAFIQFCFLRWNEIEEQISIQCSEIHSKICYWHLFIRFERLVSNMSANDTRSLSIVQ